ncbi:GGDEF domain-containing protein [Nocardia cyriacigeorgica]|uniref:Cyclic di-GMP phosphodiesterase Gmr n=1 Tax=Nocardia cyriacigeorgica TaxID=135487 RepID=A0A4U8W1Y0_9NOCA|nr:GGDEF domain-containing protein [Nocardia cyriacigeorgica]VFA99195.1 Cyclic di-GMP phosphodiesterase Gmr [Nocardia cyriacigeorgica]
MELTGEQSAGGRSHFGHRWLRFVPGVAIVLIVLQTLLDSPALSLTTMALVVAGALTMIGAGLHRHRPRRPLPWYLLSASAVSFAVGIALRDFAGTGTRSLDDAFTLAGYAGIGVAAVFWLRPRQLHTDYDLLLDSALIGLGALLASWTFLISLALRADGHPGHAVVTAIYPILDALLLALVAYSVATTTRSETSLRLLHGGLLLALLGDLGYNLEVAGTPVAGRDVLLAPLLLAYTLVGVAALHPTMTSLGAPHPIHPHHSRQRASFLAVALIVASLIPVVGSRLGTVDRVVVSTLCALLLIGVLVRSERAIVRSARSEKRAQYQADHDMLTGLLNRSALLRALARNRGHWAERPLCLLFIDLDGFKMINDSYGHAVGDELIANAASRIRRAVRRDDVVARYGGDEFVILAPLDRQEAEGLAKRLLATFIRPFELSAGEVPITASIGLTCGGPRAAEADIYGLLREADSAMYHAKEYSLGYTFYDAFRDETRAAPETVRRPWQRETAV